MAELTYSEVDALLKYDPETGKLFWKERPREMFGTSRACNVWNSRFAGKPAFTSKTPAGYHHGPLFGKTRLAHRIIWLLITKQNPSAQIDHINGDPADNRQVNLRCVTHQDNGKNQKRRSTNSSGVTGVYWVKKRQDWAAAITVNGASVHLGYFSDKHAAVRARKAAEDQYGFHRNHGRDIFTAGSHSAGSL